MLSIIISSYQPHYYIALEKNIADTIGIPYEIIKIDNPGIMGICEAYNRGAEKAQYDFLLFLHEDVLFKTKDWGEILLNILKKDNIGAVGLAGTDYIPRVPIGWWSIPKHSFTHMIHASHQNETEHRFTFSSATGLKNVKIIDGVFIACSKKVWSRIKFDEWLKNYHAYDVSFSLKTNFYYKNYITNQISIRHFSQGNPSKDWMNALILNRKRNAKYFTQKEIENDVEFETFAHFSQQLWHLKYSKSEQISLLIAFLNIKKLGFSNALKALKKIIAILFTRRGKQVQLIK